MLSSTIVGMAVIKTFGWIWKNFGKDIVKESAKSLNSPWETFEFKKAAQRYANEMKIQYGSMSILSMSAPVPLKGIFTHVNVLRQPSSFRQISKKQYEYLESIFLGVRKNSFDVIEGGVNAIEIVRNCDRLFILGKPGAGKTTLLKYLTLQSLDGKLSEDRNLIPIFVSLKNFSESDDNLINFIVEQFRICSFPDAKPFITTILKEGKALVLFDGLDEVNEENDRRRRLILELKNFSNEYSNSQIVITCRIAATDYHFERFTYVEMADFGKEQIQNFVKYWFKLTKSINKETSNVNYTELFFKEFSKNNRLYDLAKTPLLLTLLCITFETNLEFPNRHSDIYEEAFDALLKRWDASRGIKRDAIYQHLSIVRKKQLFANIAAESFENQEYLFTKSAISKKITSYIEGLPSTKKEQIVDGDVILRAIVAQHGVFAERAKGIYSFSHLTFQEYFTAKYVIDNAQQGTLAGLIEAHCTDTGWREIFLLTAEMLANADMFVEIFLGAINDIIEEDGRIVSLLAKIEQDALQVRFKIHPVTTRGMLLYLFIRRLSSNARVNDSASALLRPLLYEYEGMALNPKYHKKAILQRLFSTLQELTQNTFVKEKDLLTERYTPLLQYLYLTKLLLDCLEVAYVTDRDDVEKKLLCSPQRG